MAYKDAREDEKVRCSLLTRVLTSQALRSDMVSCIDADGTVHYRHNRATEYLKKHAQFVHNLLLVIHIGSGMPARGTELAAYRVQDGRSTRRNVFFLGKQVVLFAEYSKTSAIKLANSGISRFLDEEASSVVLKDLLIVRPFLSSIASFLEKNENNLYSSDLFMDEGTKLTTEKIRSTFCTLFYEYSGSGHLIF